MAQWDERNTNGSGGYGNGGASGNTMGGLVNEEQRAQLEEAFENARAELDRYVSAAADFVRERPVACIAGAVAIGFLVGKIASRR